MKTKCLHREDWDTRETEQKEVEVNCTGWTERYSCFNFIVHGLNGILDALRAYHNVLATDEMSLAILHAESWGDWVKTLLDLKSLCILCNLFFTFYVFCFLSWATHEPEKLTFLSLLISLPFILVCFSDPPTLHHNMMSWCFRSHLNVFVTVSSADLVLEDGCIKFRSCKSSNPDVHK